MTDMMYVKRRRLYLVCKENVQALGVYYSVTLFSLVDIYQCFRRTCYLHLRVEEFLIYFEDGITNKNISLYLNSVVLSELKFKR
jgi:hypothetical protein